MQSEDPGMPQRVENAATSRDSSTDIDFRDVAAFVASSRKAIGFGAVLCGLGAFSVFTKYAKLWNLERESRR